MDKEQYGTRQKKKMKKELEIVRTVSQHQISEQETEEKEREVANWDCLMRERKNRGQERKEKENVLVWERLPQQEEEKQQHRQPQKQVQQQQLRPLVLVSSRLAVVAIFRDCLGRLGQKKCSGAADLD